MSQREEWIKQQDADFEWFLEHYDEIYKKHGDCYLAIKKGEILGVYDSFFEALDETAKSEEMGSFIVQHCNGDESGYTNYIASTNFMGMVGL